MDDSQETSNESAQGKNPEDGYIAPAQGDSDKQFADQYAGWSTSGEPAGGGFVLGYN